MKSDMIDKENQVLRGNVRERGESERVREIKVDKEINREGKRGRENARERVCEGGEYERERVWEREYEAQKRGGERTSGRENDTERTRGKREYGKEKHERDREREIVAFCLNGTGLCKSCACAKYNFISTCTGRCADTVVDGVATPCTRQFVREFDLI
jgi:hypothetical protein